MLMVLVVEMYGYCPPPPRKRCMDTSSMVKYYMITTTLVKMLKVSQGPPVVDISKVSQTLLSKCPSSLGTTQSTFSKLVRTLPPWSKCQKWVGGPPHTHRGVVHRIFIKCAYIVPLYDVNFSQFRTSGSEYKRAADTSRNHSDMDSNMDNIRFYDQQYNMLRRSFGLFDWSDLLEGNLGRKESLHHKVRCGICQEPDTCKR